MDETTAFLVLTSTIGGKCICVCKNRTLDIFIQSQTYQHLGYRFITIKRKKVHLKDDKKGTNDRRDDKWDDWDFGMRFRFSFNRNDGRSAG